MSNSEKSFTYSNEFLQKLSKYKHPQRNVIISMADKVNNHETNVTDCGDEKFFAFNELCKILMDRKKWEFTNFDFNPMYRF